MSDIAGEPTPEQVEAAEFAADLARVAAVLEEYEFEGHASEAAGLMNKAAALVADAGAAPQELSVDRVHAVLDQCSIEYHHPEYGIGLFTTCAGEIATELAAPPQVDEAKLPAVTRVTLAGRAGTLSAEHWDYAGVEILVQDDGRTLKVLPLRGGGQ